MITEIQGMFDHLLCLCRNCPVTCAYELQETHEMDARNREYIVKQVT